MRRVGEIIDEIDLHGKNQELVKELVALATRHGILTPYTSFLADETSNIRDLASNESRPISHWMACSWRAALRLSTNARSRTVCSVPAQAPASGYGIAADTSSAGGAPGYGTAAWRLATAGGYGGGRAGCGRRIPWHVPKWCGSLFRGGAVRFGTVTGTGRASQPRRARVPSKWWSAAF